MKFTVGFEGTHLGKLTMCEETFDTSGYMRATLQNMYKFAVENGIKEPLYFVTNKHMYYPNNDFDPNSTVQVFPGPEGICKAYKPKVALITFDHKTTTKEERLELIKVLEKATSLSNFFDILPIGHFTQFNADISNRRILAQNDNGYVRIYITPCDYRD